MTSLDRRGPNGQPKNVDLSEDLIAQVFKLCETAKVSVLEAPKSLSTELAIPIEKSEPQQFEKSIGLNSSDVGLSFADHIMSHKVSNRQSSKLRPYLQSLPAGCSSKQFMFVTTSYGQHSNQLIALLNAFVIAKLLNRTLVVGHFVYNSYHSLATYNTTDDGHAEPDRKRGVINRRYIVPHELYDFSKFTEQGYCHTFRDDFFEAHPAPQDAECFRPDKSFIRMWDTRCTKTVITRRLQGHRAVALAAASTAWLIYFPETYWLLPEGAQLPYSLLQPSPLIQHEVDHFKATILQTPTYTAVHNRMLKSSGHSVCERSLEELLGLMQPVSDQQRARILRQCRLDWAYIEEAQAEAGVAGQKIFLATDRQRVELDKALMAHGAVSYHTGIFRPTSPYGLLVDFWLMVDSALFICNMASSIDWNVCNVRLAWGAPCYNWLNH
eukprot:EG_transcript_13346